MSGKNDVVSSDIHGSFCTYQGVVYIKAHDFADNKTKIIYCLKVNFADSITTDMDVVQ